MLQDTFQNHTNALREACANAIDFHAQVERVVGSFRETFTRKNKVLVAGNGGSAAEAQHLSDEMVGRYRMNRQAFPVIALTADSMVLTCVANDFGFESVFSRQIEALGQPGDLLVVLSTSGNSRNLLEAASAARKRGMGIIAFCGRSGLLREMADIAVISPSDKASVVQEMHLHAIHLICEAFES